MEKVEYKSPSDKLSVEDFYKVYAYACQYIQLKEAEPTDVTITFISTKHPRNFLEHLKKVRNYEIEEKAGIYLVGGDFFPIQVIEVPLLSQEDNFYLHNLRADIERDDFLKVVYNLIPRISEEMVKAYADVLVKANAEIFKETADMKSKQTLREVLIEAGWTKEWIAEGEARGISKVLNLLKQGFKPAEIENMVQS